MDILLPLVLLSIALSLLGFFVTLVFWGFVLRIILKTNLMVSCLQQIATTQREIERRMIILNYQEQGWEVDEHCVRSDYTTHNRQ